jgi:GT2 family glycosyltransferase
VSAPIPGPDAVTTDTALADVSVVILCHGRIDEVRRAVTDRLIDVHARGLELVVVDNASQDGTPDWLSDLHVADPDFTLVLNPRNLGVGAGRNSGWARTTRDVIVTLDEDVRVSSAALLDMVAALRAFPQAGIVHPIPIQPDTGRPQIAVLPPPNRATNFHGCAYAIRREVVDAVGMHDPDCDFGGEELDLSIRVRAAGWEILQLPQLRVEHNSLRREAPIARWRRLRWTENHARVVWRWLPLRVAVPASLLMLAGEVRASLRSPTTRDPRPVLTSWFRGVRQGVSTRQRVPRHVARFYGARLGLRSLIGRRNRPGGDR